LIARIIITQTVSDEMDKRVSDAEDFLSDILFGVIDISLERYTQSTEFAVVAALATATAIAFITALSIALMEIPSWAMIALQFCLGVSPFIDDPCIKLTWIAPDQTAYLFKEIVFVQSSCFHQ
jgi:hypothetical protein